MSQICFCTLLTGSTNETEQVNFSLDKLNWGLLQLKIYILTPLILNLSSFIVPFVSTYPEENVGNVSE